MSIAHTPSRIGLPTSDMSDREALGDGEEVRVATDGDLACRSIENSDADRGLALCASQPGIVSGRVLVFEAIEGEKELVSANLGFPKETESVMTPKK